MLARRGIAAAIGAVLLITTSACGSRLSQGQLTRAESVGLGSSGQPTSGLPGSTGAGGSAAVASGTAGGSTAGTGGSTGSAGSTPVGTAGATGSSGTVASSSRAGAAGSHSTAAASGGSAAATCSSAPVSGTPGVTNSTITVGNVSTLTGPVPGLFAGARDGIEAFAAYLNSTGGVCGRKLQVDAADDDMDASQNATATQSLANSVLAFVGSFSVDDQGGASVLASDGIPDVGEPLSSQREALPNNFAPQPIPTGWNVSPYLYFKQRFGEQVVTHMAFFAAQAGGEAALQEEQALEGIGYKFVYSETTIQPTQTDFSAEVQSMKADGVQGLVFQAPGQMVGDMAKDMYDAGFTIPFANWGAPAYAPSFISTAGPGANGAVLNIPMPLFAGQDASSVPEVALLDKYYEALYGTEPDLYAAYGWMSGMLFVEGLDAGGSPTRAALLKGLKTITDFTAGGLSPPDDPAAKKPPLCYLIVDVKNGTFVRDAADPATGFKCDADDQYYYVNG